jgi:peptidoglycan hydrolase CwlO-like protein
MIGGVLMMSSCGSGDSDLTKLSKKYDDAVENVKKQKGELKDAQEELKEAQERVEKEKKDIVNAEKEAAEIKGELQKAKVNPIGE